jgi:hypothetical protein
VRTLGGVSLVDGTNATNDTAASVVDTSDDSLRSRIGQRMIAARARERFASETQGMRELAARFADRSGARRARRLRICIEIDARIQRRPVRPRRDDCCAVGS